MENTTSPSASTQPVQPIQSPPPAQASGQPQPIQTKNSSFLTTLLSLLLLLAVGAAGFFAWQTQNLVKQLTELQTQPEPTTISSPEPTTDPIVDWKTYQNEKFNFQYPKNSTLVKDNLAIDGSLEFDNFIIYTENTSETLTDYIDRLKNDNSLNKLIEKDIGDLSTIEWIGSYKNAPTHHISFIKDKSIYSFGVTPIGDISHFDKSNSDLLNQILSTFKFIDPDSVACTKEAKVCPDGSSVERVGPDCEFAACPTPIN